MHETFGRPTLDADRDDMPKSYCREGLHHVMNYSSRTHLTSRARNPPHAKPAAVEKDWRPCASCCSENEGGRKPLAGVCAGAGPFAGGLVGRSEESARRSLLMYEVCQFPVPAKTYEASRYGARAGDQDEVERPAYGKTSTSRAQ
jgi:hypothetical protein